MNTTEEKLKLAREALELAMTICDSVPTRLHQHEDETIANIGKLVNLQPDGTHGYTLICNALTAIKGPSAPAAAAPVPDKTIEQERADFECWYLERSPENKVGTDDCANRWAAWLARSGGQYSAPSDWKISPQPWGVAAPAQAVDALHLIYFDDRDRRPEIIVGSASAEARFAQVSGQWNAHLFVKVKSNSRDDPHYGANAALAAQKVASSDKVATCLTCDGQKPYCADAVCKTATIDGSGEPAPHKSSGSGVIYSE